MTPTESILDSLEAYYGPQEPGWPTDPYLFLVWWHCGYSASDASCAKGWASLRNAIGVDLEALLRADTEALAQALKAGGMVPELRARRLQEIAERVQKEFGDDLGETLRGMPLAKVRTALKKFPNIADPGVDRILLFAGLSTVAAVPSNCPQVLVRIRLGQERENYATTYKEAQQQIDRDVPPKLDARIRAYLLLKQHGQTLCKRTKPKCGECPIAASCAFFGGAMRGRPAADR